MKELVASLSNQIREAYKIGENTPFSATEKPIHAVLVCGLGGSGIGGKIISQLVKNELRIPFLCINDYELPAWVNENTLIIASSYSGNTEETIAAVKEGLKRGSEIVAITSGGTLEELANQNGWNKFIVPGGEQPRAMLAYSLVQQIYILVRYGLIEGSILTKLAEIPAFLDADEQATREEGMRIAVAFNGKRPIIYGGNDFEGIVVRWRQQINENAKELVWHHVFPEMTHNELVGWAGGSNNEAPIFLKSSLNHPRTARRWEIAKPILAERTSTILETEAKGDSKLEQDFYLIHLNDWISYFMAEIKQIDAVEVEVISHLKSEMAKMK
jgi:glucose/mannose-6-phosphate isomerase